LLLYFRSRCDDVAAWKQLQELAKKDDVAKALVCDVLIHNDALQRVGRDVELARLLSKDVHYWIAATNTENDPTIHGIKLYISGVCLAQGIGIPKNQARAAASIEQAAELGCCLAHYYMGVWFREGRGVARNAQVSVKLA
jgi:TPR repeat protein